MLDDDTSPAPQGAPAEGPGSEAPAPAKKAAAKKAPAKKAPAKKAAEKKAPAKRTTKKVAAADPDGSATAPATAPAAVLAEGEATTTPAKKTAAKKAAAKKAPAKRTTKKVAASEAPPASDPGAVDVSGTPAAETPASATGAATGTIPLFQAPEKAAPVRRTRKTAAAKPAADEPAASEGEAPADQAEAPADKPAKKTTTRKTTAKKAPAKASSADQATGEPDQAPETDDRGDDHEDDHGDDQSDDGDGGPRRRRRRGGRRRRKSGDGGADSGDQAEDSDQADSDAPSEGGRSGGGRSGGGRSGGQSGGGQSGGGRDQRGSGPDADDDEGGDGTSRRRRRRRRAGEEGDGGGDDPENTVTRVRSTRSAEDQITAISGSTRLEAKKQRRRDGREAGRRRAPIVSEAEFLARRESVDRVMVIRQREDLTQIAVLEDKVLVEHYVARESQTSLIGNVYLGRVQNVLPSMEAAFIDIGKGRNAVLYAGEVNWQALGHKDGQPRKIESVLSSGQPVLVQVTKDPVGHKGARLTSQVSLAGRFLVYVPDGTTSGISRKLPDTERSRLKALLKEIVPDSAGVIVRTAAEGASEDELTRDVERLKARWDDIEKKSKGNAPQLLYGEPDLTLKVVRDLFTEDFTKLVIAGDDAWDTVQNYVSHVAPDLEERLEKYDQSESGKDAFDAYRIDEQIAKALDRKVWLPSGGSLVIDRTEAMTVVDVNTGKFTGSGGNLEETVTKNNLEAAEEVVRQLRLRDIGGIIVVDFIDMVLESNRDLVLRRLVECLGRDRTRHQVAEVTSLGLVQMTRKRIGTGLLEAFSENCEHCQGRGLVLHDMPVESRQSGDDSRRGGGRSGGDSNGGGNAGSGSGGGRRSRGGRGRGGSDGDQHKDDSNDQSETKQDSGRDSGKDSGRDSGKPSPKDVAAMARHEDESGGSEKQPAERRAAEKQADEQQPAEKPTEAERADETPAVDTAPTVTSRSRGSRQSDRRGGQKRAAATPDAEPEAGGTPEPTPEPVAESAPEPSPEPVVAPEPPAEPLKPQVVTRTRRRSASRPAGPPPEAPAGSPVGTGQVGAPAQSGVVEPGTADAEPGTSAPVVTPPPPVVEHVPIKKRGTRKR